MEKKDTEREELYHHHNHLPLSLPQPPTLTTQKLHHHFTSPASPPSSPSLPPPVPPPPPPRADGYKRVLVPWGSDTGEPSAPLQPATTTAPLPPIPQTPTPITGHPGAEPRLILGRFSCVFWPPGWSRRIQAFIGCFIPSMMVAFMVISRPRMKKKEIKEMGEENA